MDIVYRQADPLKIGLGQFKSYEEIKGVVRFELFKEPLYKKQLYNRINASEHFIYKAFIELMNEGNLYTISFVLKEKMGLKDHLNYYSTNPKFRRV